METQGHIDILSAVWREVGHVVRRIWVAFIVSCTCAHVGIGSDSAIMVVPNEHWTNLASYRTVYVGSVRAIR